MSSYHLFHLSLCCLVGACRCLFAITGNATDLWSVMYSPWTWTQSKWTWKTNWHAVCYSDLTDFSIDGQKPEKGTKCCTLRMHQLLPFPIKCEGAKGQSSQVTTCWGVRTQHKWCNRTAPCHLYIARVDSMEYEWHECSVSCCDLQPQLHVTGLDQGRECQTVDAVHSSDEKIKAVWFGLVMCCLCEQKWPWRSSN